MKLVRLREGFVSEKHPTVHGSTNEEMFTTSIAALDEILKCLKFAQERFREPTATVVVQ
jgi:hypothetical protein